MFIILRLLDLICLCGLDEYDMDQYRHIPLVLEIGGITCVGDAL